MEYKEAQWMKTEGFLEGRWHPDSLDYPQLPKIRYASMFTREHSPKCLLVHQVSKFDRRQY